MLRRVNHSQAFQESFLSLSRIFYITRPAAWLEGVGLQVEYDIEHRPEFFPRRQNEQVEIAPQDFFPNNSITGFSVRQL